MEFKPADDFYVSDGIIGISLFLLTFLSYIELYKIIYYFAILMSTCIFSRPDEPMDFNAMQQEESNEDLLVTSASDVTFDLFERFLSFAATLTGVIGILLGLPIMTAVFLLVVTAILMQKLFSTISSFRRGESHAISFGDNVLTSFFHIRTGW